MLLGSCRWTWLAAQPVLLPLSLSVSASASDRTVRVLPNILFRDFVP